MNFTNLILKLDEARVAEKTAKTGESARKDRLKANATDNKAKDAARKRAERAKQVPRERKSKQELIKEVLLVRTQSGNLQLIFKDSYDKNRHEIVKKENLTIEEAQQAVKDPKFEQTRASQLLFGDVKAKEPKEKEKGKAEKKKEAGKPKGEEKAEEEEKPRKAKRMSKEDIFKAMSQMDGAQLAQMPLEMRQEYFKATRQPPSNVDFDNMSYEALSVKFNLSPISNLPYNQQVLNALMFLAKMKAGASEQEMQTYGALAPTATEFTRSAFFTARKILSQIGDECIQNLVSTVEAGPKPVNSEGAVDMECGNYKFKVSAGGEISLSTTQFDQSNKSFRGLIATALMQTMNNPEIASSDPKMAEMNEKGKEIMAKFATTLIPDDAMAIISQDPKMLSELQKLQLKDSQGNDLGPAVDADGNLNPAASMGAYRDQWLDVSKSLLKGKNSPLKSEMASMLLKSMLRGDNRVAPEMAPNHLITVNGVFPMTDDYFAEISKLADIDIKPAKDLINSSNIGNYKSSAAERMKKFRALVEQNEEKPGKKPSLKDILMDTASINPMEFIIQNFVDNNDFTLNASLLPGFTPKDLNAVQYNYLTIGKKTIKIPVENSEKVHSQMLGEGELYINDLLIESLSNNFVLRSLSMSGLLTNSETVILENGNSMLLESFEQEMILKNLYERAVNRAIEDPEKLEWLINVIEEYKRDYKKEYKNYHGKPKQRKERAARTAARELMIKKGKVRKGDGKDIDHKKPLRNGGSKGINNLRVRSKSENRSDNGHEEGETQDKGSWK